MFFHFRSFSFIFFHFSFIFFHFLSFSLLAAQIMFFLGLNFVTISLHISLKKIQFFGPSRGVLPLRPLFLFFPFLFFSSFFFFFFLDLVLLFFPFSFLKNVFLFFYFLASVSEFNCFLRSRCSMEMRCPDDIGRVTGIGLGRLLGGEHASTPQSGVYAPRMLKRRLTRLYYCCCCCDCSKRVHSSLPSNWHEEPSMTKNSSSSRAQLPEEREKCAKTAKNNFTAAITQHC